LAFIESVIQIGATSTNDAVGIGPLTGRFCVNEMVLITEVQDERRKEREATNSFLNIAHVTFKPMNTFVRFLNTYYNWDDIQSKIYAIKQVRHGQGWTCTASYLEQMAQECMN
jgi:hypothetical protein